MTESLEDQNELDVEGVEGGISDGWGDYPLDAVFVRTETRTVAEVVKRIDTDRYILDPDFQRDFVWPPQKQSKLIESCIMRIPLPVFYVAEAEDGRIIVVDGLQRLTTFTRFLHNDFKLAGLTTGENSKGSHALEGHRFEDLPLNLQERVQDTQLTMYILDAKAPERARLDIFERVNSGAALTRQQMRNALYSGPATRWLKMAAESEEFQNATGRTLNQKTMRDREAINRFCAFKLIGREKYTTGDMDNFLAAGLTELDRLPDRQREELLHTFKQVMNLNYSLFGEHAFRKSLTYTQEPINRSVINISLFEVCAVVMATPELLNDALSQSAFRGGFVELLRDPEFSRSITYSTNSTASVQKRFTAMENLVQMATL